MEPLKDTSNVTRLPGAEDIRLREPPHNFEAEQALLGAILVNNAAYQRVAEFLKPDHFADPLHGKLFDSVSRLIERGQVVSAVTLKTYFEQDEAMKEAGGAAYLARLAAASVHVIDAGAFGQAPSLSIDHAVMEHTDHAAVVPVDMAWNDVGSWPSLHGVAKADANGNVIKGDVVQDGVSNSYLRSEGRLLAAVGVDGITVVATDDAVLVAGPDSAGAVSRIVERLRREKRPEPLRHPTCHRPWGNYRTVDAGDRFQVKRITVKPGAKLSLQKHYHRAEHWVVVRGTAIVQCGEDHRLLHENQSIYIPVGTEHRLENPGKLTLELIEVQSGDYLGEDDIVRLSDNYGRA